MIECRGLYSHPRTVSMLESQKTGALALEQNICAARSCQSSVQGHRFDTIDCANTMDLRKTGRAITGFIEKFSGQKDARRLGAKKLRRQQMAHFDTAPVAQASKPAVAQVSKPADGSPCTQVNSAPEGGRSQAKTPCRVAAWAAPLVGSIGPTLPGCPR